MEKVIIVNASQDLRIREVDDLYSILSPSELNKHLGNGWVIKTKDIVTLAGMKHFSIVYTLVAQNAYAYKHNEYKGA